MTLPDRVVVVGASAAGLGTVEELRRHGYSGALALIGAEAHLPYDRPPLSKQLLTGAWAADKIALTTAARLAELDVDLRLDVTASALDAARGTVTLADGAKLAADAVVVATGCTPRHLAGSADVAGDAVVAGVHTLRTVDDSLQLRSELGHGRRLVVIGAGFLGLEVAAVASGLGSEVTVVSAQPPLLRVVGSAVSRSLAALHSANGVQLRIGSAAARLMVDDDRVCGVELADGSSIAADSVVVAVGATPTTDWLIGSGLTIQDGVVCDSRLQAAPFVYAVGDIARWHDPRLGRLMRVEHRMHATESASVAAANLLGADAEFSPIPFWWTDQYSAKIQAYGWVGGTAHLWDGELADHRSVVLYSDGGIVTGALGWNSVRQLRAARALVVAGTPLADAGPTTPLA
ncbi:MAG: FAD-dependent oxidoreductase [Actinomycetota bacterium]|nr:FAD-dependent oxidoreductase [Actinomycetota bacterium]